MNLLSHLFFIIGWKDYNEKNKNIISDSIDILKQISGELSKKLIKESKINKILIDTIKIDSISKIKLINSN